MRRAWIVVLSVFPVIFFTSSFYAQVPVLIGNNIDVSSGLTLVRRSPSVAYNIANNEYLIVWFDLRNQATTGDDVFGQRVSADGSLLGENIPIAIEIGAQGYSMCRISRAAPDCENAFSNASAARTCPAPAEAD